MPEVVPASVLTPVQRRRVSDVVTLALQRPPDQRSVYIATACADDAIVREKALAIVASHDNTPQRWRLGPTAAAIETPSEASTRLASMGAALLSARDPRRHPGSAGQWGEFTLLEELGRGGFGVVYRAWDAALCRDVALKLVDVRHLPPGHDATLLREGQLLARVRHPNVVSVFSAQAIGHDVGLAMEYIRGQTLSALLAQQGPMSAHEAAVIGAALCSALAAVHRVGLIHRDIKASNIMREHGGRIVLMDFGAGRAFDDGGPRGVVVGTPLYMAPEILRQQEASPASDVYSVGVLLYHLVTGAYPVQGQAIEELCTAHVRGARRPLGDARPELPEAFVQVVERALVPDTAGRYQTALALRRDLVSAMPGMTRDAARRAVRRARTAGRDPVGAGSRGRSPWVQRLAGFAAGGVLLAAMMGFITTQAFNRMFGRSGPFADDTLLSVLALGVRSLLAPIVTIALAVLVATTAVHVGRWIIGLLPPVRRAARAAHGVWSRMIVRTGLDNPAVLAQVLCVATGAALAAVVWVFNPLLGALMSTIESGVVADLALLATEHVQMHLTYRWAFDLLLLCAGTGMALVVRRARRTASRLPLGSLAGIAAAIAIGLVLLAVPWRILWSATFPRVQFAGEACYVVGQSATDQLVTCPARAVPRTRVVRRDDPRVAPAETVGRPFDDFARLGREARAQQVRGGS